MDRSCTNGRPHIKSCTNSEHQVVRATKFRAAVSSYLSILCVVVLLTWHPSSASMSEVAPRFLENLCTRALGHCYVNCARQNVKRKNEISTG
jgi:hypothetical protein